MLDTQLFNRAELLENLDGDDLFAKSLLEEALLEIPKNIVQLKKLCKVDEQQDIRICAHTIKGMAANLCIPALRDAAFKIELAAREGELETARSYLPELERIATLTLEAIKR